MSKVKVRCQSCGKWFQSGNAKDTICPECAQKNRKDRLAAKSATQSSTAQGAGSSTPTRSVPPAPKPKSPAGESSSHWIDSVSDVKIGQPDEQIRPKIPSYPAPRENRGPDRQDRGYGGPDRQDRGFGAPDQQERGYGSGQRPQGGYRGPGSIYREQDRRTPPGYRVGGGMGLPDTATQRPRQPFAPGNRRPPHPGEGRPGRPGGRPVGQRGPKRPAAPPRPKKEKIPPPLPFKPTEEQVAQIEARYLELAVPKEFDGIRTQISKELNIPKSAVRKVVKDLRERMSLPSWWEVQAYTGTAEELEKIKALYEPHLPLPEVGVHKEIAEQMSLKPGLVYQAIKQIRLDMNLPQFNDPLLHGEDFAESLKRRQKEAKPADGEAAVTAEAPTVPASAEAVAPPSENVGEQTAPAEVLASPGQSESAPEQTPTSVEIAERETDMTFKKEGETTEVVPASSEQEAHEQPPS